MATKYIHEFSSLANFNMASRDKPNSVAIGAVSNVFYNGLSSASTPAVQNWELRTQDLSKTIRLNSQTDSATASGDLIGFQSKPRTGVAGSQNVIGCQISAQISDGIALSGSGSVIGGHIDVYVRGTAAGTIAGDVRGLQIEMTTDDAGTRTVSGNVSALRIRSVFSATTITGKFVPIRIEKPETQTNSKNYDAVLELTSNLSGIWKDAPGTEPTTADGYFKVLVNGNARYVQLYSGAPVD